MVTPRLPWLAGRFVIAVAFTPLANAQANAGYTVTLQEVLTTRNGASSVVSLELQAQRQDGATVLQLGPEGQTARHIRLPPGLLIDTNDREKRKATFYVSPDRVTSYPRDPQQYCRRNGDDLLGEEMIGGYRSPRPQSMPGARDRSKARPT
jgi:hypothetical protein